ncbi:MAG: hypothetical protein EXR79_14815 [Myxococcales bacterium]|nr:hypothetical protein [Myxococcales bacterium]
MRTDAWGHDTCTALCNKKVWADCEDGNPCSFNECLINGNGGCTKVFGNFLCSDNDACTASESCDAAQTCVGTKVVCDDKNPCTADTCKPATGCSNGALPDTTPCGSGKVCKSGVCS